MTSIRHQPVFLAIAATSLCAPLIGTSPRPTPPAAAQDPAERNAEANEITFQRTDRAIRVVLDGELFTALHIADVQKPYLYPVIGPGGVHITRGYPMEQRPGEAADHSHHTSLWFAHGDVNGHDFWHGGHGERIVHVESTTIAEPQPALQSVFEWRTSSDEVICTERRTMRFGQTDSTRFIDFDITLTASTADITFGDTKEGTFGLRLAPTLRLKGDVAKGSARNSEGVTGRDVWGRRARWIEYAGPIDDRTIGVVIFDHPDNPRHPTWWHAREYGLVAANPFGRRAFEGRRAPSGTLVLAKDASIRFRYRVLIHEESWDAERIDRAFEAWTQTRTGAGTGTENGK